MPPIMSTSVFVYGSLMAPEVVQVLLGRLPKSTGTCRLWGYTRHPVKDQVFPAIVASGNKNNEFVDGLVLQDLTPHETKILDWFEDDDYTKTRIKVECLNNGAPTIKKKIGTVAYVWANPHSELELDQEWSFDNFSSQHLDWFMTNTVEPCKKELDRLGDEL